MSTCQTNGVRPSDSAQEIAEVIPDSHYIPGASIFGNRYAKASKLKALQESDACTRPGGSLTTVIWDGTDYLGEF